MAYSKRLPARTGVRAIGTRSHLASMSDLSKRKLCSLVEVLRYLNSVLVRHHSSKLSTSCRATGLAALTGQSSQIDYASN